MELLQSKHGINIPKVFFITTKEERKEIPIGVPFIFGDEKVKDNIIRILEYEVLFQNAMRSGYPFKFKQILNDNGFTDLIDWDYQITPYLNYNTDDSTDPENVTQNPLNDKELFVDFVRDSSCVVDVAKIKALNIFPIWLETIENAISTNIHNFSTFNTNMYNKKLEGMYGALEFKTPERNLICIDISASIPKAVGTTTMTLSKTMAETFYCDLLITGRDTIFIPYEEIYTMDIPKIYDEYGNNQECATFRKIITADKKVYNTCIIFGDNHSVCGNWGKERSVERKHGQKRCKWEINNLIAFHTTSNHIIPGFADWFKPNTVEHIKDWVKYLN